MFDGDARREGTPGSPAVQFRNRPRFIQSFKKMEHSNFIENFGLPILGILLFAFGILIGLILSDYIKLKD